MKIPCVTLGEWARRFNLELPEQYRLFSVYPLRHAWVVTGDAGIEMCAYCRSTRKAVKR